MDKHAYKWYSVDFDPRWCTCRNSKCRARRTLESIKGKRKCPSCRLDNQLCITKKKDTKEGRSNG
jgi:hypothetical protein